jgi:hypothetical protein
VGGASRQDKTVCGVRWTVAVLEVVGGWRRKEDQESGAREERDLHVEVTFIDNDIVKLNS